MAVSNQFGERREEEEQFARDGEWTVGAGFLLFHAPEKSARRLGCSAEAGGAWWPPIEICEEASMSEIRMRNAISRLLSEASAELGIYLQLHPGFEQPKLWAHTANYEFRIHVRDAVPDRVLTLSVWPLDVNELGRLDRATAKRIRAEILAFWDGRTAVQRRFVDTTKPAGPSWAASGIGPWLGGSTS